MTLFLGRREYAVTELKKTLQKRKFPDGVHEHWKEARDRLKLAVAAAIANLLQEPVLCVQNEQLIRVVSNLRLYYQWSGRVIFIPWDPLGLNELKRLSVSHDVIRNAETKNAIPLKGNEVNLALGGIDLNSSGSVVVKEYIKLLTALFADGRDGRTFTLKAETLEDLYEWKSALEEALSNAPSAALVMGQNGIFKNDQNNAADVSSEQTKERPPVKSLVIGRPILLALDEIDGSPSFLEKALRFVEEHATAETSRSLSDSGRTSTQEVGSLRSTRTM